MAGYSPWGRRESGMTKHTSLAHCLCSAPPLPHHLGLPSSVPFMSDSPRLCLSVFFSLEHHPFSSLGLSFSISAAAVASVVSDSVRPHRWQPTRLPRPWDSPGKNTEVGCHFLLQCMKVKSESEVAQSCPTLSDPMDCSLPGSSVHGIFQARVLEWGAIAFSVPHL